MTEEKGALFDFLNEQTKSNEEEKKETPVQAEVKPQNTLAAFGIQASPRPEVTTQPPAQPPVAPTNDLFAMLNQNISQVSNHNV